jgi:hypothetical protein
MTFNSSIDGEIRRERDASACIRRHHAFALAPVRERRFRVYKEAPGFRLGPRERERRVSEYEEAPGFRLGPRIHSMTWRTILVSRSRCHASACIRRHHAFALAPATQVTRVVTALDDVASYMSGPGWRRSFRRRRKRRTSQARCGPLHGRRRPRPCPSTMRHRCRRRRPRPSTSSIRRSPSTRCCLPR